MTVPGVGDAPSNVVILAEARARRQPPRSAMPGYMGDGGKGLLDAHQPVMERMSPTHVYACTVIAHALALDPEAAYWGDWEGEGPIAPASVIALAFNERGLRDRAIARVTELSCMSVEDLEAISHQLLDALIGEAMTMALASLSDAPPF